MRGKHSARTWGTVLLLGAVWGLAEAGLGLGLKSCARFASGSIMTSVALFFLAAAWSRTGWTAGLPIVVIVAGLFKLFDARLLSLPIRDGAVANPLFAFAVEGLAFLLIFALAPLVWKSKLLGRSLLGGGAALGAVAVFPLVKFCTGIPACVLPGTTMPLAWYYGPLAVGLSLLTVPLGVWAGRRLPLKGTRFDFVLVPAALASCLGLVALIHLI